MTNKRLLESLISQHKKLDSLGAITIGTQRFQTLFSHLSSVRLSHSDRMLIKQWHDIMEEKLPLFNEIAILKMKSQELMDSFRYEPPKYGYEIKFRQSIENELKINQFYGYIDSLSMNVKIMPSMWKNTDSDNSSQWMDFIEVIDGYAAFNKKHFDIIIREDDIMRKLESL